jgi:hypothetical protein
MAMNLAQAIATQLERVRDVLPLLYERDDVFLSKLQARGDIEKVSGRLMRLPLQIRPGGKARGVNFDGGDMGRGGGTLYDVAQVTPQGFAFALEWTKIVEYSTNMSEKAIAKLVPKEVQNGMKQFRAFLDKICQTSGNGVVGTISSISGQVLTMSNQPGAKLVYPTQDVQIYDTTITTNRGKITAAIVDRLNKQITADPSTPLPNGTVATDVLVYDGLSGPQPIGLFGIPYHQSNATTGTWLNMNRATYPVELRTSAVNLASASVTPGAIMQAINFIRLQLGTAQVGGGKAATKLAAYTGFEQAHAYRALGISVSNIIKEGPGGGADDLELNFMGKVTWYGAPEIQSANASANRVDFIDFSHWGRAEMKEIDFYETGGNTKFPIYGASGGISAAEITYIVTLLQIWNDCPPAGAYLYNAAIPAGY